MADETEVPEETQVDNAPEVEEVTGDVQINARALSGLIADYLQDRDDIASANIITTEPESGSVHTRVMSQGGTVFDVVVIPGDIVEA